MRLLRRCIKAIKSLFTSRTGRRRVSRIEIISSASSSTSYSRPSPRGLSSALNTARNESRQADDSSDLLEQFTNPKASRPLYREQFIRSGWNLLRLFRFRKDEDTDALSIDMQVVGGSPVFRPPYIALSYVWGSPEDTKSIKINGHDHSITRNLWDFLVVLRAEADSEKLWFWADQMCIDQGNLDERAHQVSKMGDIYRDAQVVFGYLGPKPDDLFFDEDAFLSFNWKDSMEPEEILLAKNDKIRKTALDVFTRPYWTRLWILQEICLAKYIVIWCGSWSIERRRLMHFCRWMSRHRYTSHEQDSGTSLDALLHEPLYQTVLWQAISLILDTHKFWIPMQRKQLSLLELLVMSLHSSCSEPRDRIFGLLAMVAPEEKLTVDYSRPLDLVALDAARIILRTSYPIADGGPSEEDVQTFAEVVSKIAQRDMVSEVRALIWSHLLESIHAGLERDGAPSQIFQRLVDLATTAKQRECIADMDFDPESLCLDSDLGCRDVHGKVRQVAARHGFVSYGQFMAHPDDWPFPDEHPTRRLSGAALENPRVRKRKSSSRAASDRRMHVSRAKSPQPGGGGRSARRRR